MTEEIDNWQRDLTREKNFRSMLSIAGDTIGGKNDYKISGAAFIAITMLVLLCGLGFRNLAPATEVAVFVSTAASAAVQYTISILGFLIAGFAIFATLGKKETLVELAQTRKKGTQLSELKFVYFNFLYVFVHFIVLLAASTAIAITFAKQGPSFFLAELLGAKSPIAASTAVAFIGGGLATYFIHSILLLRTFMWNLYQSVLYFVIAPDPQ